MKKCACIIFSFLCIFVFTSCSFIKILPDSVTIESREYIRVFDEISKILDPLYADKEGTEVDGIYYFKANYASFDCYVTYDSNLNPCLYIEDNVFDEAVAYYKNPENYHYYCLIGNMIDESDALKYRLTDIDTNMFNQLTAFAQKYSYKPFAFFNDETAVRYEPIPDPDNWIEGEIYFYRETKTGLFRL